MKRKWKWTLLGLIGLLLLVIGVTVKPLFFFAWVGSPLIIVSLYLGIRDYGKV